MGEEMRPGVCGSASLRCVPLPFPLLPESVLSVVGPPSPDEGAGIVGVVTIVGGVATTDEGTEQEVGVLVELDEDGSLHGS